MAGSTEINEIKEAFQSICSNTCFKVLSDLDKNSYAARVGKLDFFLFGKYFCTLQDSKHFLCVVEIFRLFIKGFCFDEVAHKLTLFEIAEKALQYPDILYPVYKDEECSDMDFSQYLEGNKNCAKFCLLLFMDILHIEQHGWTSSRHSKTKSPFQEFLLKRLMGKLLIVVSARIVKCSWSNPELHELCKNIFSSVCACIQVKTIGDLLGGNENSRGAIKHVFAEAFTYVKNKNWKQHLYLKHSLIWCITKVQFPMLTPHLQMVLPFLFQLLDDYDTNNKRLGISTVHYVMDNVSPADLRLYNHIDVIYDTLFKQLYSNESEIYQVAIPCLLKTFDILKLKNQLTFNRLDHAFDKLLANIEFNSKTSIQSTSLQFVPNFLKCMTSGSIKHVDRIIKVVGHCLNIPHKKEKMCMQALEVLQVTIEHCWVVIDKYQSSIIKILLKFAIDSMWSTRYYPCSPDVQHYYQEKLVSLLKLMSAACGEKFDEKLKEVVQTNVSEQFHYVKGIFSEPLSKI